MENLLASRRRPAGQDHKWHSQVLYFMNWQIMSIQRKLHPVKFIKHWHMPLRKTCAMNVAVSYRGGKDVQERIMKHEKLWIQKRRIPASTQGKNAKMMCMLEDEGTMMVVQKCIAGAGSSKLD